MNHSEQINDLAGALAKAQGEFPDIPRNREVEVRTKAGGSYKFKYATFDAILGAVRPALSKHGLSVTQTLANGDGKYRLVTTLFHASGQWISSEAPLLVTDPGNQAFGSALTYMRRYAMSAALGVAADEDDDANAADGNQIEASTERTPKGRTAAPKVAEDDKAKAARAGADRIKEAINGAQKPDDVDNIVKVQGPTLASIKEVSQTAYEFLMKFAEDRKTSMLRKAA